MLSSNIITSKVNFEILVRNQKSKLEKWIIRATMNECQKGKDQGERVKVMRNFFRLQIRYKWNNVWEWLRTMKKNKIAAKQNRKWIRRNSERIPWKKRCKAVFKEEETHGCQ